MSFCPYLFYTSLLTYAPDICPSVSYVVYMQTSLQDESYQLLPLTGHYPSAEQSKHKFSMHLPPTLS